jgi:hypothetical protein
MRIVHLSDTPLSAAPYRLMKVQRIAGLDARLICGTDAFGGRPRLPWQDILVSASAQDQIMQLLRGADVVHIHNRWTRQRIFKFWPEALEIVTRKPKVLQFHSPRESLTHDTQDSFSLKCPKLVVAQYQVRQYPEATPVPNVVPIDDVCHTPYEGSDRAQFTGASPRQLSVAFSPSSMLTKGWDNKGYPETKAILRGLQPNISHKVFTGIELPELLLRRKPYDVCIDEIMTGSYHLVSLEGLSQGQATVANLDDKTIDALERITGPRKHPWICANTRNLGKILRELDHDRAKLDAIKKESRDYMVKYWDPFRVTQLYKAVYEHC